MVKYKDIAELCNVSTATVSYVLNRKGSVSAAMRQKVLQTAMELGYEGSIDKERSNRIIRLYCANLETLPTHMFFNELLTGIFSVTMQRNCDVIVTPVPKDGEADSQISLSSQMLCDGILVINPRNNPKFLEKIKESKVPCLIIGRPGDGDDNLCYVDSDNVAVGYQMTKYMLENGHRSTLFVNGPETYTISQDRLNGYKMALRDFGMEFDPEMVINCDFTLDDTCKAVSSFMQTHDSISAVIANSDISAIGALEVLNQRKLRVPKDCSLICGGESVLVRMYPTPITGVDIHHTELGRCAAKMMLDMMDKTLIRPTQYYVPFELHDRGSVRKIEVTH